MRVAIIGGGFGLNYHLPAFTRIPGVEVVAISDSGSGNIRAELPDDVSYQSNFKNVFSLPIDAVSIAVPPYLQKDIVITALKKNKHVFCEKPFGLNLTEAREMLDASIKNASCVTAVNFQFRFEPGICELKRQLELGTIGSLCKINFSWLTSGRASASSPWTWRNDHTAGGGVIRGFFSHAIDLIWWLTNQEVSYIQGQTEILIKYRRVKAGFFRRVTAEDMIYSELQLAKELNVTCEISNCRSDGQGMKVELIGHKGRLVYCQSPPFRREDQTLTILDADSHSIDIPIYYPQSINSSPVDSRLYAVSKSVEHFVRKAKQDKSACPPDFSDALRAHRVMKSLIRSSKLGHSVLCEI
jgi:predicted dehydrogenase